MLLLVDEDVPQGRETFAAFGAVRTFAGRAVTAADVADADALVVRSVTRVDAGLLAGSRVRFVGTVTSGADHVDEAWLAANGIAFASAAGGNADAVAEYVLAAVLLLAERLDFDPTRLTLGVVGVGRIGARVARWGRLLGMGVLLCDPPLQRQTGDPAFISAAELARDADVVTLHVPLTREGPDATAEMVDAAWLARLKTGAIFINTARGEVVGEDDLSAALDAGRLRAAVLDVWRGEPHIDAMLVQRAALATPHVAGYSLEARRRAERMIRDALANFINSVAGSVGPPQPTPSHGLQAVQHRDREAPAAPRRFRTPPAKAGPPGPALACRVLTPARPEGRGSSPDRRGSSNGGGDLLDWWREAAAPILRACDVAAIDAAFRSALSTEQPAAAFDEVRRHCAARREFRAYAIPAAVVSPAARAFLRAVGFQG